jgi:hypothetical protein
MTSLPWRCILFVSAKDFIMGVHQLRNESQAQTPAKRIHLQINAWQTSEYINTRIALTGTGPIPRE